MLGWEDRRAFSGIVPAKQAKHIRNALGIDTVEELIVHFPRAWSHHGSGVNLDDARDGDVVTCIGEVIGLAHQRMRNGRELYKVTISDGERSIGATFFQAKGPQFQLVEGVKAMFSGKLKYFRDRPELSHPSYAVISTPGKRKKAVTGTLRQLSPYGSVEALEDLLGALEYLPVYPARKGTTSWEVLGAIHAVLGATPAVPEPLGTTPDGYVSFDDALRGIHFPDERGPEPHVRRMKFNEALTLCLVMALRRAESEERTARPCPPTERGYRAALRAGLPFQLTDGQQRVLDEISADLAETTPMNRLLQGEVGSGKTIVSLLAMLQVVDAGRQCAMMAPTEVLAFQHARSLTDTLGRAGVGANVVVLTGGMPASARKEALLNIVSGQADIVVGTHALFSEAVEFFDLGMVVVDEQHRFGVDQRDALRRKAASREGATSTSTGATTPHLLVMTATPIPRTVAITAFGGLSVSSLEGVPSGRKRVTTSVVPSWRRTWRDRAFARIREECEQGRQAYVVCPRIEGQGGAESAHAFFTDLYPGLTVGLLHGRLNQADKDEVMTRFAAGEIDVLVATTVIEVGVDVPNATVMLIWDAENFGVSQLHQLRGRVGRGEHASICLLMTRQPADSEAYLRLSNVAATSDGARLAALDLESRHAGDILGTQQHGVTTAVHFLDFLRDGQIIADANEVASALVRRDPQLARRLTSDVDEARQEYIEKG